MQFMGLDDHIVGGEFDVESGFLSAQKLEAAYFISNENISVGGVWGKYGLPILLRNSSVKQIIRVNSQIYNFIDNQDFQGKPKAMSRIIFDRTAYEVAHLNQTPEQGSSAKQVDVANVL